jgi:hypothetical protein
MKRILALIVGVALSVPIAEGQDEKATPPQNGNTVTSESDWRLAKQPNAQPRKIGVLTYYPNKGGGYTFIEGQEIVLYALPYLPTTYDLFQSRVVTENRNGVIMDVALVETTKVFTVSKSKMPFAGQTLYRPGTHQIPAEFRREHIPIAKWTRDTPDGKFRLSIMAEDSETRLKLKSIVPVLEHAEHGR